MLLVTLMTVWLVTAWKVGQPQPLPRWRLLQWLRQKEGWWSMISWTKIALQQRPSWGPVLLRNNIQIAVWLEGRNSEPAEAWNALWAASFWIAAIPKVLQDRLHCLCFNIALCDILWHSVTGQEPSWKLGCLMSFVAVDESSTVPAKPSPRQRERERERERKRESVSVLSRKPPSAGKSEISWMILALSCPNMSHVQTCPKPRSQ